MFKKKYVVQCSINCYTEVEVEADSSQEAEQIVENMNYVTEVFKGNKISLYTDGGHTVDYIEEV